MRTTQMLAVALLGTVACGPSIRISRDRTVPVPAGASWTWGASDAGRSFPEMHPMVDNVTVRERIERVISSELAQKGFRKVADSTTARFLVHFHVGVEERHEIVGERPPCIGEACTMDWGYWGRPEGPPREIEYEAGQLMVDIVDGTSLQVIWRGVLEHDFVKTDVEEARLAKYVRKLLTSLPTG